MGVSILWPSVGWSLNWRQGRIYLKVIVGAYSAQGLSSSKILHLFIFWPYTVVLMFYFWPILKHFTTLVFLFFTSLKLSCLKLNFSFFPVWFLSQLDFGYFPDNSELWKVANSRLQDFLRPDSQICSLAYKQDYSICVLVHDVPSSHS